MGANEYAEQAVTEFIKNITDHVFLSIQQDRGTMRDYMSNVDRYGLDTVNMAIGKKVKTMLDLDDNGENITEPKSTLIKGYTYHSVKN
jgi:hypothetical protein